MTFEKNRENKIDVCRICAVMNKLTIKTIVEEDSLEEWPHSMRALDVKIV